MRYRILNFLVLSFFANVFLLILLPHCVWASEGLSLLEERKTDLTEIANYLEDGETIFLNLTCINAKNNNEIFIGGSYDSSAYPYRSVLLISRNGGKDWHEADCWIPNYRIVYIYLINDNNIRLIACWAHEGQQAPYSIISTSDGGKIWKTSKALPSNIGTSLCSVLEFSFISPTEGRIVFGTDMGVRQEYKTEDGGITWLHAVTWKVEPKEINDFYHPALKEYKIETDWKSGHINIKYGKKIIGTLPYRYQINKKDATKLEPIVNSGGK